MPVTASAGGDAAFCMKRTLSAMPPTLAGVTRLTNDEATCASTLGRTAVGSARRRPCRPPTATYVTHDITTHTASHTQFADRNARMLSSTLASCGSRM